MPKSDKPKQKSAAVIFLIAIEEVTNALLAVAEDIKSIEDYGDSQKGSVKATFKKIKPHAGGVFKALSAFSKMYSSYKKAR